MQTEKKSEPTVEVQSSPTSSSGTDSCWRALLHALQTGDREKADDLLRRVESVLPGLIRLKLNELGLRHLYDTQDIHQSVLADLLVKQAKGRLRLDKPENLPRLMAHMAVQKIRSRYRRDKRQVGDLPEGQPPIDTTPSPSEVLANAELAEVARQRLGQDEFWIHEQRMQGRSWEDIADKLEKTPAAVRMRHARALLRVAAELGS